MDSKILPEIQEIDRCLDTAYTARPDRFTRRPRAPQLSEEAWINQPTTQAQTVSI